MNPSDLCLYLPLNSVKLGGHSGLLRQCPEDFIIITLTCTPDLCWVLELQPWTDVVSASTQLTDMNQKVTKDQYDCNAAKSYKIK